MHNWELEESQVSPLPLDRNADDLGLGAVYAGRYIDDAANELVVLVTGPIDEASVPSGVRIERVSRSLDDLMAIKALVRQQFEGPEGLTSVGIDVIANRVVVGARDLNFQQLIEGTPPFEELIAEGAVAVESFPGEESVYVKLCVL